MLLFSRVQHRICAISVRNTNALVDSRCVHFGSITLLKGSLSGSVSTRQGVSSNSSSRPPDTSLFVPLSIKSDVGSDGAVGAELTQPLDKSTVHPYCSANC